MAQQRLAVDTPAAEARAEPQDAEAGGEGGLKKPPAVEPSLSAALPAILFWITMSCCTILYNKYLYTSADKGGGNFRFPLTLTAIHMGFATVATAVLRLAGVLKVPSMEWRFVVRSVLPIGLLFAMSLAFSNLAAMRLTVSFIQMVKALTPLLTLAISVALSMEVATTTLVCGALGYSPQVRVLAAPHPSSPLNLSLSLSPLACFSCVRHVRGCGNRLIWRDRV